MEMSAQLAIAPIAKAWETFQKVSRVHHIANDQDYDNATRIADALLEEGAMDAGHPQHSLFMTISDLIYAYDQTHYPQQKVSGVAMLRFLMEQHGLTQSQLPEIGKQSVVSEILAGKRSLTVDHIRNLSARFSVSPAVFFE